jgi:hypothetical protein
MAKSNWMGSALMEGNDGLPVSTAEAPERPVGKQWFTQQLDDDGLGGKSSGPLMTGRDEKRRRGADIDLASLIVQAEAAGVDIGTSREAMQLMGEFVPPKRISGRAPRMFMGMPRTIPQAAREVYEAAELAMRTKMA